MDVSDSYMLTKTIRKLQFDCTVGKGSRNFLAVVSPPPTPPPLPLVSKSKHHPYLSLSFFSVCKSYM